MGLIFNRGCAGHHYKEKPDTTSIKIKQPYLAFDDRRINYSKEIQVIKEKTFSCLHESCSEKHKEEEVLRSIDAQKFENFCKLLEKYDEHGLKWRLEQPKPKEVRKQQCFRLYEQIKDGEYESLDEMKEALKEAADIDEGDKERRSTIRSNE